jgi:hypothetical protein
MQVTHSTHSAPFSPISGSAALSYIASNHTASKCFASNASISNSLMSHNASRPPSIAGDVFAVVVWAAMVPCFMWLGNVMGL